MFQINYILFLQILFFLFITPGTPRIVIISHSMNYGVKKCIWTALGDVSANIIQGTLVIFVIGSFFLNNPNFLNTLKWVGIAYLFYLAYDVYKTKPKDLGAKNITEKSSFSFYYARYSTDSNYLPFNELWCPKMYLDSTWRCIC